MNAPKRWLFVIPALMIGIVIFAQGGDLTKGAPQTVEQRLAKLETRLDTMTARVNDLETELIRGRRQPEPLTYPNLDGSAKKLASIVKSGWYLTLADRSGWDVKTEDVKTSEYWRVDDEITVFHVNDPMWPYVLVNSSHTFAGNAESVRARFMASK